MAATCSHGLPASECLICRTLSLKPDDSRAGRGGPTGAPVTPAEVVRSRPGPPRRRPVGLEVAGVIIGVIVVALLAWSVVGVAFAVLHALELVAAALVAGWVGYRIGHFRGRRDADRLPPGPGRPKR